MCGIAGIVHFDGGEPDGSLVQAMGARLSHRGPDERGAFIEGSVGFAHHRLSIIDRLCGQQPMRTADGSHTLCFNGEIFNYIELREGLAAKGMPCRTTSDTEVLLLGLAHHGWRWLTQCNAQCAFACFDHDRRCLTLARDENGEKPLYYWQEKGVCAFGSELKALLPFFEAYGIAHQLSYSSLWDFLSLNYVPGVETLISGVAAVPPGHALEITDEGVRVHAFDDSERLYDEAVHEGLSEPHAYMTSLLDDAVRLRTRSDVPVGLFLSGGVDSTSVAVSLAAQQSGVKAFIASFDEAGFDESGAAQEVCEHLGLSYQIVPVRPHEEDLAAVIDALVMHGDEPLADSSALPMFLLSRETAKEVAVVMSGDGGDEAFAGYLTYDATLLAGHIPQRLRRLIGTAAPIAKLFPARQGKVGLREQCERFFRNLDLSPGAAHFAWNGMWRSAQKLALLHPRIREKLSMYDTFTQLANAHGLADKRPTLSALCSADQREYLVNDILAKVDRMTMAHGLEARPVFVDRRIRAFGRAYSLHAPLQQVRRKRLLVEMLSARAPWYSPGKKQGFSIPVHHWFRTVLRDLFEANMYSATVQEAEIFDQEVLTRIWKAHQSGKSSVGFELWGILVLMRWLQLVKPRT